MTRVLGRLVCALIVLCVTGSNAWAQAGATAQISGVVKDQSGAVLPGVDVTVTQTGTGQKRNAVSDADGSYVIPNLPIGPYRLDAMLQGFRTFSQTGIVLQVGASPVINIALELGQVSESVTVQASSPLVDTKNTGVGQVMDNKRILEIPLNGRNPADLIANLPAAVPQPTLNATSRSMQGGVAYSVAGGLPFGISYSLDGAIHNNPYDNLNLPLPFPDALQEFKAETSSLTAQNGMHSAGAVTAVTKSGTNSFRGDGFEFFRHHALNATDRFAAKDANGERKDDGLKRNQYGVTLGGPLKVDKVFFFAGYQGTNTNVVPTDAFELVPTAAMLTGDFTAFASAACNGGRAVTLGAPFSGNKINPAAFSKAALNITSKLPTTSDPCGRVQYGLPAQTDENQFVGKVDYQFNNKHSFFGRYLASKVLTPPPFQLDSAAQDVLVTRQGGRDNLAQMATGGWNNVISSSTLNAVRFAFNRTSIHRTSVDFFSAPEVGINIYTYVPHYMLLTVGSAVGANITGFQLGGGTESESTFTTNLWQVADDLTMVKGNHTFAFGGNVSHWNSLSLANVRSPGQLSIDGSITGTPLSDFMLGRMGVNALVQAAPNTLDMTQTYLGLYGQDSWRMSDRITLNVGLRWEPFFPQQLVNGAVYQFDKARFDQNVKSTVFPNAPAGLYFPGDPGFPTQAGMLTQWGNLGPRVGVAWDPASNGRTIVRASYSKAFEFVNGQFHLNTSVAPPWGSEVRINSPTGGLDNPFINTQGQTNIFPVTFDKNAPFSANGPFLSLSNNMDATNVHLWNVTAERQLGSSWVVSAGYVGSKTNNIWESTPLNNGIPTLTTVVINGVTTTCVPGSAAFQNCMNGTLNARRPLTVQDPSNGKFYGPTDLYVTDGTQRYDAMILSARLVGSRRSAAINYALSHCHGSPEGFGGATTNVSSGYNQPTNPHYDDGNCTADRLHNFSANGTVQSPDSWGAFGKDWRLTGTFRALSGPWLTITTGVDRALNGQTGTQRADQVAGVDPYLAQTFNPVNGALFFLNPAAFAQPAFGTFGNSVRNSIRGIGSRVVDMSLLRNIRVMNSQSIELRIEAFNIFNWDQWSQPSTAVNATATFGQITSIVNQSQRIIQLAIKYQF